MAEKKTFEDALMEVTEVPKTEAVEEKKPPQGLVLEDPISWADINTEDNKKEWLWENYVAKSNITLLSALWKAGKSTFLRCLFLAMAEEEEFAGQPTKKGRVLVLSEEAKGEWADQREDVDEDLIRDILIWSRPIAIKANLKQWIELIEIATKKCIEEKVALVVIDTLSSFWPVDNENDSAQVMKALVPLYKFTNNNIAVLLIHHFRKGGGDQAQASRGSGALPGFVDNIIEFSRKEDGLPTQRVLKTYGRFDSVIPTVVIELQSDGKYKTIGQPWEVSKKARMENIVEIFFNTKEPLCSKDVTNLWVTRYSAQVSERTIRRYILELESKNILSAVETKLNGKKVTPYYLLSGTNVQQRTTTPPYTMGVVLSSVKTADRGVDSLSAVNSQNVPATEDRTGITPITEDVGNLPGWEDPDPTW